MIRRGSGFEFPMVFRKFQLMLPTRHYRILVHRPANETRPVIHSFQQQSNIRQGSWPGWSVLIVCMAVTAISLGMTACDDDLTPPLSQTTRPGVETQITSNHSPQRRPRISGSLIVWEEWQDKEANIYLHDITTRKSIPVAPGPGNQRRPAISGRLIVWEDWRSGDADIYLHDLTTGRTTLVAQGQGNQSHPDISGTRVVWQDDVGGDSDIYLHDLESQTTRVLTEDGSGQFYPAIAGTRVVWEDVRFGSADIFEYDLTTEQERRITDDPSEQLFPDIAGDLIAWVDFRNGEENIYMFDLSKDAETQVTFKQELSPNQVTPDFHGESQRYPALSGHILIWQDYVWNYHDIFVLDLSMGTRRRITGTGQITRLPDEQAFPDISGRRIVWQDVRNGNSDIYLFDLDGGT